MNAPVVDSHVHLWDPEAVEYPWLSGGLRARFGPDELDRDDEGADVARIVVEADAAPQRSLDEVEWIARLAEDARVVAVVARAPLEQGGAVRAHVRALAAHPLVVGVRRVLQAEPDGFATSDRFIDGLREVEEAGLVFDACVASRQLAELAELADAVPGLTIVLDHLGKPAVGSREAPASPSVGVWRTDLGELARRPNVVCKLSGLPAESPGGWSVAQVVPFLDAALEVFGPRRLLYGGDWPVSRPLSAWRRTVAEWAADRVIREDAAAIMGGNARRIYAIGRGQDPTGRRRSPDMPPSTSRHVAVVEPDRGLTR